MAGKISEMTAGDVANLVAATSGIEVSNLFTTVPVTRRYTFGQIAQWMRQIGFATAFAVASLPAVTWSMGTGSGADNAAGNWTVVAPLSTGAGTPASLIFQTGAIAATSSTVQTATTVMRLGANVGAAGSNNATGQVHILRAGGDIHAGALAAYISYGTIISGTTGNTSRYGAISLNAAAGFTGVRYNGTLASPSAPLSGEQIVFLSSGGYDGTNWTGSQGSIGWAATENWGATARGTRITMSVTPNTTTTAQTALTIDHTLAATFAGALTAVGATITGTGGSISTTFAASNAYWGGNDGTGSFLFGVVAGAVAMGSSTAATYNTVITYGASTAGLTLDKTAGAATFASSITTSAPTTGTAAAWKLGVLVTAAVVPDTSRYIQLDVAGTLYKMIVST